MALPESQCERQQSGGVLKFSLDENKPKHQQNNKVCCMQEKKKKKKLIIFCETEDLTSNQERNDIL